MTNRRVAFAVLACLAASVGSVRAECNNELIDLVEWQIEPIDEDTNLLTTRFRTNFTRPVRLLDASAEFEDVLGEHIASFAVTRDVQLAPGEVFEEEGRWGPYTFERLLVLRREEVLSRVCVRGVVYENGDIERF